MKHLLTTLLFFAFTNNYSSAQSVLAGAGTPVSQAMLEVRSTNRGILIPRMTTLQRNTIPSPKAGLLVFDISNNQLYRHDGVSWRYIIDDSFWKISGSDMYNNNDSVGINTSSPDEKLQVAGDVNINNGDMELIESSTSGTSSKIQFDYTGGAPDGYIHGLNFYNNGTRRGFLQYRNFDAADEDRFQFGFTTTMLTIQSNGVTYINAANATIQLQTASVDKGFVQLAGNDFRLGTNSSNTNGRFIIRTGGTDRLFVNDLGRVGIGTAPSGYKLHVSGNTRSTNITSLVNVLATNVEIGSELNNVPSTGTYNLLPAFYGKVNGSTAVCSCSSNSISVWGIGGGNYFITYPGISANDILIVKTNVTDTWASSTYEPDPRFRILTWDNSYSLSNVENMDFSFIVFKP